MPTPTCWAHPQAGGHAAWNSDLLLSGAGRQGPQSMLDAMPLAASGLLRLPSRPAPSGPPRLSPAPSSP